MKEYTKDPAKAREWIVEFYGPDWASLVECCYDPLYSPDYVKQSFRKDFSPGESEWRTLKGNLRQSFQHRGYEYKCYQYPKSMKECLRVIKMHESWFIIDELKFRLRNANDPKDIIPHEVFAC